VGEAAIPALYAAMLQPEDFSRVTLRRMIGSWESVVSATETFDQLVNVVHGALQRYDLPDLIAAVGPEKVAIQEPSDVMGRPAAR